MDGWTIVEDGAWGKLTYTPSGKTFRFVFNGHGLEIGSEYSLIYYPDRWPGTGLIVLATGTAVEKPKDEDGLGDINLRGNLDIPSLPIKDIDDNYPDGAKIWLVLTSDLQEVEEGVWKMGGWNPGEYLFENNMITYEDTDD
jgi:hypothetical protein